MVDEEGGGQNSKVLFLRLNHLFIAAGHPPLLYSSTKSYSRLPSADPRPIGESDTAQWKFGLCRFYSISVHF